MQIYRIHMIYSYAKHAFFQSNNNRIAVNPAHPQQKQVAVFRTSGIGDVILSFRGLALLHTNNIRVFYIGYGPALDLIALFFPEITVLNIGKNNLRKSFRIVLNELRSLDAFIDLQGNSRSIALRSLLYYKFRMPILSWHKRSLAKRWYVLRHRILGRSFSPTRAKNYDQPNVEQLMYDCLYKGVALLLNAAPFIEDHHTVARPPTDHASNTILIAPGGSHELKHLPANIVISLIREVSLRTGSLKLILIGDSYDAALCANIEEVLSGKVDIMNIAGTMNLPQIAKLMQQSDLLIGTDSALSHLARFLDLPCITLFGPTIEGFGYTSSGKSQQSISAAVACRPCSKNGDGRCAYHDKLCYARIDLVKTADRIVQLMAAYTQQNIILRNFDV